MNNQRTNSELYQYLFDLAIAGAASLSSFICLPLDFYLIRKAGWMTKSRFEIFSKVILSRVFVNTLLYYLPILSTKDLIRSKFISNVHINNNNPKNKQIDLNYAIWVNFFSSFIPSYILSILIYNSGRPKVQYVSILMQQQKLRQHYKKNSKSLLSFWKQVIKRRNCGLLAHSFGSGFKTGLQLCIFDTCQLYLPKQLKQLFIPNVIIGTVSNLLSQLLFRPIIKLSISKISSKTIKDPQHPYLYQRKSYTQLILQKFNNKVDQTKKFHIKISSMWAIKTGVILTVYQFMKQKYNPMQH